MADELSDLRTQVEAQREAIDRLTQRLDRMDAGPMFGINLGIFGDADFSTRSRERTRNSFSLGEADIYSAAQSDRLILLSELVIEPQEDGFELDLERLWIGYAFSDLLIVRAGKHHAALGYWNRTYHHGKHLFVAVDRPFFLAFEHDGGVIPIHVTGLEVEGNWGHRFARFKYEVDIVNGYRIQQSLLVPNDVNDDNGSKQVVLRLSARPERYPGLSLGAFGTRFAIDTAARTDLVEWIYGMDAAYVRRGVECLAEYFRLENSEASGSAYYAQLAYEAAQDIRPYVRFESLDGDAADPYLGGLAGGVDRRQFIAGIRYDIDVIRSGVKAQVRYDDTRAGEDHRVFEAQWTFGF